MEKAKMELKEKNNYTEESVFLNKLNFDEKNFILIRGHQGSGKSTLAKNIANAAKEFGLNESDIFHIERDFFMYDENGEYSKVFNQEVYKKADDKFRAAFSDGFNKKPKLIIVSKTQRCNDLRCWFYFLNKHHQTSPENRSYKCY